MNKKRNLPKKKTFFLPDCCARVFFFLYLRLNKKTDHVNRRPTIILFVLALFLQGCLKVDDTEVASTPLPSTPLGFDISVTRDGKPVTKGEILDAENLTATLDPSRPFSLIAIEKGTRSLLLDNEAVYNSNGDYTFSLGGEILEIPTPVLFSAYYPRVRDITYDTLGQSYSVPFRETETQAGPLVSKTVERSIQALNTLPLEFGHITNDIGFKICDVTPQPELQGLIHLRRLTAWSVASAGVYENDIVLSRGNWNYQGYYRNVTVFEGDAPVGVGSANELYVGRKNLVNNMAESNRFYAIPDEIMMGRQYVEVVFDVEGFSHSNGYYYEPLKNQVFKYLIYGVLPDNVMIPGKQYTFHIGLDLSSLYREITFAPAVASWETKIYENNDDF